MKPQFNYRTPLAVCLISIAGIVGMFMYAHAQTGSPAQWSAVYTSGPLSSCPTPSAGTVIECSVTNAGIEESVNGGQYVPVNQPGIQGSATAVTVGKVTTLAAGSSATVTVDVISTPTNVVLDFGIPSGPQGSPGTNATAPVTSVNGKTGAVILSLQ